jgi:membrane protein required for colicin V production
VADDVILIFLMVFLIRGAFRGPLVEMFSAAGTLFGLLVACRFYSSLAAFIPLDIGSDQLRRVIIFLLLFVAMHVFLSMVGFVAQYLAQLRRTGWLIRLSGAGLGICNGVLLIAVFLVPLITFFPQQIARIGRGNISTFEKRLSETIVKAVPGDLRDQFLAHVDNQEYP